MKKISQLDANILIGVLAGSALIYEMILAATLGLLFGDSIFYFSLTIALFILFMGLGSASARWFQKNSFFNLVMAEIVISALGVSCSSAILLVAGLTKKGILASVTAVVLIFTIGFLAGVEIPIIYSITDDTVKKDRRFGYLLFFDYLGALLGAVIFSFILLPKLDLIGSGAFVALLNLIILTFYLFKYGFALRASKMMVVLISFIFLACGWTLLKHDLIQQELDRNIFQIAPTTEIKETFRTRYQKVTLALTPDQDVAEKYKTQIPNEVGAGTRAPWISIYLNNFNQAFSPLGSETDLYHHAFVHPAMVLAGKRENILVLGGGDGLPAKEILKYPEVQNITNVDLDGEWVHFTKTNPLMRAHSFNSLNNPKVHLVVSDAFQWVRQSQEKFDVILVDFPEGIDLPLARSYSLQFLRDLKRLINKGGVISFQVDFFNNPAYWCVVKTMMEAGFNIIPHRVLDPIDDHYGLILLSEDKLDLTSYDQDLRKYSFINPNWVLSRRYMEFYRDEDFIRAQTQGLMTNTFFHPSFLYYYRVTFPWDLFIGNND